MKFEQVRSNVNKNRSEMSELQNNAATQKRVTKPSDDPVAAARVLTSRVDVQGQDQYMKSTNYAKSFLEFTDQSLGDLSDLLVRAKELALGQSSDGSANEQSRRVVGTEVEQLYNQMVHIGNRKHGDRFIFGGFKTTQAPFNIEGNYQGDGGEMLIHVDKDSFVSMNVPGNKVFLGETLSTDGISHATAIQPRTVEELQEALEAEKQNKADGDKSNHNGDPAHRREDGPNDRDVPVRGLASVDEPEYYSEPPVEESRGRNIFNVVKNLEISLMANDKSGIQESLDELDTAMDQVVLARAQVGARSKALENSNLSLQKAKVDTMGAISQLEDADLYHVVSDMNKNETALKATMQASGKLIQPSLMDFLR
ncbi:MAG: flagellar hook-associated protein 3 [Bdellovibrionaceae bacterium]|nr:flagellar hook-associated protein 3 [Pseudobdellovibrionaceae bacterium]